MDYYILTTTKCLCRYDHRIFSSICHASQAMPLKLSKISSSPESSRGTRCYCNYNLFGDDVKALQIHDPRLTCYELLFMKNLSYTKKLWIERLYLKSENLSLKRALRKYGLQSGEYIRTDPLLVHYRNENIRLEQIKEHLEEKIKDLEKALMECDLYENPCKSVQMLRNENKELREKCRKEKKILRDIIADLRIKLAEAEEESTCAGVNRLRAQIKELTKTKSVKAEVVSVVDENHKMKIVEKPTETETTVDASKYRKDDHLKTNKEVVHRPLIGVKNGEKFTKEFHGVEQMGEILESSSIRIMDDEQEKKMETVDIKDKTDREREREGEEEGSVDNKKLESCQEELEKLKSDYLKLESVLKNYRERIVGSIDMETTSKLSEKPTSEIVSELESQLKDDMNKSDGHLQPDGVNDRALIEKSLDASESDIRESNAYEIKNMKLKSDLEDCQNRMDILKDKNDILESDLANLRENNRKLQERLEFMEVLHNADVQPDVKHYETEINNLKNENSKILDDRKNLETQNKEMEAQWNAAEQKFRSDFSDLENVLDKLREDNQNLQEKLYLMQVSNDENLKSEIEQYQIEINKLKTENAKLIDDLENLERQNKEIEAKLNLAEAKFQSDLSRQESDLKSFRDLNRDLQEKLNSIVALRDDNVKRCHEETNTLKIENSKLINDLKNLEQQNKDMEMKLNSVEARDENKEMRDSFRHESWLMEIDKLKRQNNDLENDLKNSRDECDSLNDELSKLKLKHETVWIQTEKAHNETVQAIEKDVEELKRQNNDLQKQLKNLQKQCDDWQKKFVGLQIEQKSDREKRADEIEQMRAANEKINNLKRQNKDLENALENLQEERDDLTRKLIELKLQQNTDRQLREEEHEEMQITNEKVDKLERENNELQKDLKKLLDESNDLKKNLYELKIAGEREKQEREFKNRMAAEEVGKLKHHNDDLQNELKRLQNECDDLKNELIKLKSHQKSDHQMQVEEDEGEEIDEMRGADDENDRASKIVEKLQWMNESLIKEVDDWREKYEQLKKIEKPSSPVLSLDESQLKDDRSKLDGDLAMEKMEDEFLIDKSLDVSGFHEKEHHEYKTDSVTLKSDLEDCQKNVDILKIKNSDLENDLKNLRENNRNLQEKLDSIQPSDDNNLKSEIIRCNEGKNKLEAEISRLTNDLKNLEMENKEMEMKLNLVKDLQDNDDDKMRDDALEAENYLKEIEELKRENDNLNIDLKYLREEKDVLKNELDVLILKQDTDQKQREKELKKISIADSEVKKMKDENNDLQNDLKNSQKLCDDLKKELDKLKLEQKIQQQQSGEGFAKIRSANEEDEQAGVIFEKLERLNESLNKEVDDWEEKYEKLRQTMGEKLSAAELLIEELRRKSKESEELENMLSLENKNLKENLDKLERENRMLQKVIDEGHEKYEKLNERFEEMKKAYEDVLEKLQLFEKSRQKTKDPLDRDAPDIIISNEVDNKGVDSLLDSFGRNSSERKTRVKREVDELKDSAERDASARRESDKEELDRRQSSFERDSLGRRRRLEKRGIDKRQDTVEGDFSDIKKDDKRDVDKLQDSVKRDTSEPKPRDRKFVDKRGSSFKRDNGEQDGQTMNEDIKQEEGKEEEKEDIDERQKNARYFKDKRDVFLMDSTAVSDDLIKAIDGLSVQMERQIKGLQRLRKNIKRLENRIWDNLSSASSSGIREEVVFGSLDDDYQFVRNIFKQSNNLSANVINAEKELLDLCEVWKSCWEENQKLRKLVEDLGTANVLDRTKLLEENIEGGFDPESWLKSLTFTELAELHDKICNKTSDLIADDEDDNIEGINDFKKYYSSSQRNGDYLQRDYHMLNKRIAALQRQIAEKQTQEGTKVMELRSALQREQAEFMKISGLMNQEKCRNLAFYHIMAESPCWVNKCTAKCAENIKFIPAFKCEKK